MQTLLNKITYYFLNRAYTQLEAAGDLQNADTVAEFLEDYYAQKVNQGLTGSKIPVIIHTYTKQQGAKDVDKRNQN